MKPRPRSVENEVADRLTEQFQLLGFSPVERIPVLGRTGPDITINECGLAVDVKSRLEVPKLLWRRPYRTKKEAETYRVFRHRYAGNDVLVCEVCDLAGFLRGDVLTSEHHHPYENYFPGSKLVNDWLAHMAEWADPLGYIPAIVCHRPRMRTANAAIVIRERDLRALRSKLEVLNGT